MKIQLGLALLVTLFFTSFLFGQDFNGIATYKTQRKLDVQLDSTQFNDEMRNQMMAMLKKQFERTYTLDFTSNESLYRQEEQLDNPGNGVGSGGVQIVIAGGGESDILYKNRAENRFSNQLEVFGKQFLIKDALEEREWVLEKETKNIGEYTCFKATYKTTVTVSSSVATEGGDDDGEQVSEEEEEITVTAWYTPQIPVKDGPRQYGGLPGLILEVSDGSETILCSKIVMNPKDGVTIKEPNKGKEVSQEEYEVIMTEKMKEMNERYEGSRRRGEGHRIRIGG